MEELKVFHRLEHITKELDRVTKAIRLAKDDSTLKVKNWIVLWFLLPIMSVGNLKALVKIKTLDLSPGMPLVAGFFLYGVLQAITELNKVELAGWIAGSAYILSFIFLAPRAMCNFKSGYFRLGAYVFFRNQEYELFKSALAQEEEFYFASIPNELHFHLKDNQHYKQIYERLDTFLNQEKRELEIELKQTKAVSQAEKEEYKIGLVEFDNEIGDLVEELSEVHITIKYLLEFIKSTNIALYRKKNNCFSVSDLVNMVGTGITIYELVGNEELEDKALLKIYDEGTSGASPPTIALDEPLAAARVVLNDDTDQHEIDEPSEGRFVVSRLFKMGYNKLWVINFHPDSSQEKALLLTIPNEVLNTREIMRVIHSMCLLMQENDLLKKGDS